MKLTKLAMIACISSLSIVGSMQAVEVTSNIPSSTQLAKDENIVTTHISVQDAKLRKQPDPYAEIIEYIDKNAEVIVQERINDWYKVIVSDQEGYVYRTQVEEENLNKLPYKRTDLPSNAIATYVIDEKAKLREKPDPEEEIVAYLEKETVVFAVDKVNDWYKVTLGEEEGYIYKTQIEESNLEELSSKAQSTLNNGVDDTYIGYEVVEYAKQFLGNPYVYGGNSLTNGVDCSGFTTQIMKKFGVSLSRSSRAQYASNGYHVSEQDILPGDLVFYAADGRNIDHVAIYAGNNQIIHANSSKTGICMSKLHYGKPLVGIKRVLK